MSAQRLAHLTLSLDMGGLEKLLVEFVRHADRKRFAPEVIVLGRRGLLADEIEACGVPVTALNQPEGLRPGLLLRLALLLRRRRIRILHTHDERPHIYGTVAAVLAGVPRVVHTRHSQGKTLSGRQRRVVAGLSRLVDRFVCVSKDSAARAVEAGVPRSKVALIWNGIDTERFRAAGPCADGPAVTVARLNPEKDVDNLIRATALVRRSDPTFRVEIAGDGPCLPDLQRRVAELELNESVTFLGLVRDVPGLLARAGLFVLPSLTEGISLTLLEAMACGLPVAATGVGGTPEVVAEGVTGLLTPSADPAALAAAILRLRREPELARHLGAAGRQRIERHFDVRRMVAAYERLYLGERKSS
jgi:glycosyltransferase involved in cell wall biosynthesis